MALIGKRDGRNFGYGRQLSYAGPQALRDLFGGRHYGTVKAHSDCWQEFARWFRSEDWISYHTPTPPASGESNPNSDH